MKCVLDLAVKRKYIGENAASAVKHFNELRERPVRRMLTIEEEQRMLEVAPPYLRVAIILLTQTGGRTYSEGFSLRWDQVDFEQKVIRLDNNVKTPGSVEPIPLSDHACEVLEAWRKEQGAVNPFVFPSPVQSDRPISTVKTVWKASSSEHACPISRSTTCGTFSVLASAELLPTLLCSERGGIPAQRPSGDTS